MPVHLALTQTKLPVKLYADTDVLVSAVKVVPATSNQSSSVGVVARLACILMLPSKLLAGVTDPADT